MGRRMPWQHIDEVFISFKTFRMSGEVIRLMTQAGDNLKLTVTVRCWSGSNGASVGEAVNTGSDLVSRHSLSGISRSLSAILVSVFLCCFSISF